MTDRRTGALLRDLATELPGDVLVVDRDRLAGYRRDQAAVVPAGWPAVAVLARTAEEVRTAVRLAAAHRVPVVPRGAGSGLAGGANAVDGCLLLSLHRMTRILEIDELDLTATVEPGVLNGQLSAAAAARGLWYPPDPASAAYSTLGGNIATNAGGLCCLKYGVTRDHVLSLDVVLADGSLCRTGGRTLKGVAGYDLTSLFVGSEGTLGVVTRAVLRLRPAPAEPTTMVAFFARAADAGRAVGRIAAGGVVPSMLELMDRETVAAVDEMTGMGLDGEAAALLVARSDAGPERGGQEMDAAAEACEDAGATYVVCSTDPVEAAELARVRGLAYPALEKQGATLLDDVAVPRSRVPDLLDAVEEVGRRRGVRIATFGHAGDGNMHPTIVYDRGDPAAESAALGAFADVLDAALALGGTVTGEHGVGLLKQLYLARELGASAALHAAVKRALDPGGLLNPGKAIVGVGGPRDGVVG